MRLSYIALALVPVLLLTLLAAGCTGVPEGPATPTPEPIDARFAPGDLLRGDLAGAGFDDPNGTPVDAAIVVLEYRQASGEYVYTLVRPVPDGWAYVYPSGDFVETLARDRATFESYRLERTGSVDLREIRSPPNAPAPRPS